MRTYVWLAAAAALLVSLSVVATAGAGGGNSANATACQKGGWMNLVRQDGTSFANQGDCVSYGASGFTPKPPGCTAGIEDFGAAVDGTEPGTFTGGRIDGPYSVNGGIVVQGTDWSGSGSFATGTQLLFTGHVGTNTPFRLTFTSAVGSVQLDADSFNPGGGAVVLTAYDASDGVLDTESLDVAGHFQTLRVTSTANNIAYFTISSPDTGAGTAFTHIQWSCV